MFRFLFLALFLVSFTTPTAESFLTLRSSVPYFRYLRRRTTNVHYGSVLSKSAILRASSTSSKKRRTTRQRTNYPNDRQLHRSFLQEATNEALYRQELISQALDRESHKIENDMEIRNQKTASKLESINRRRNGILSTIENLKQLKYQLDDVTTRSCQEEIENNYRTTLIDLGFDSILRNHPNSWKINSNIRNEYGRPRGFDGLVFYSPLGVPILIGKPKAHKDECLRRISQGADLWFQVEDYNGSRVLLRTSLQKGCKGSKACMQMAADLAALYSDWCIVEGQTSNNDDNKNSRDDGIPVMYTDSRHVAKRGGKVGQMRQRKSLGRIYGHPRNVLNLIQGKVP